MSHVKGLKRLYLFKFLFSLHFFSGVLVPFFTDWGGLELVQVMLLQSVFGLAVVLLEVPTGAVADRLGRKVSLSLGAGVLALGALLYSWTPDFWLFVGCEIVWAAGLSLLSGADVALVYDRLKEEDAENQSRDVLGRFAAVGLTGMLIGAPVGSLIAHFAGLRYAMMAYAVPAALAAILVATVSEPRRDRESRTAYFTLIKNGWLLLRNNRSVQRLVVDKVAAQGLVFFVLWLHQPLLGEMGVAIGYFGLVMAGITGVQIPVSNSFSRLERLLGSPKRYAMASALIAGLSLLGLGWVQSVPLAILLILIAASFGLTRGTLMVNYLNKFIESDNRATMLSIVSMIERLCFAILYPLVGLLADHSLRTTFIVLGALLMLTAFVAPTRAEHFRE